MNAASGGEVGFESRAAKGSLLVFLFGDGFGRDATCSEDSFVGLPRLIGTISGRLGFSSTGGALYAPIMGGDTMFGSGEGRC